MISKFVGNNWFMLGLITLPLLVLIDATHLTVAIGIWLKTHHGPDLVIFIIFLLSGMALNTHQLKQGITDLKGTLLALFLIFIISPCIASLLLLFPLQPGIVIGLLLVSAMPTTLSSGVVMTGSAGGNMAHALLITIIANSIAVFSIPIVLTLLLSSSNNGMAIEIDQIAIMIKLASLVLLPLLCGIFLKNWCTKLIQPVLPYTSYGNQIGILIMVWMAVCAGKAAIVSNLEAIRLVLILVFSFHLLLVAAAFLLTQFYGISKGKRESIIFMGGQKTLPLSVILQVSLFPEYGIALVVCVTHHIIHLIMDAYLIKILAKRET